MVNCAMGLLDSGRTGDVRLVKPTVTSVIDELGSLIGQEQRPDGTVALQNRSGHLARCGARFVAQLSPVLLMAISCTYGRWISPRHGQ